MCLQNFYKSISLWDLMLRMQKKKRTKTFHFNLPLLVIISGIGAASKLETNDQKENKLVSLEYLFWGLLKNCRRQSKSEKWKCKNVINCCFYLWKNQLLMKNKNDVYYQSISCSMAHLSPTKYIPIWRSKTIQFFHIFKGG